MPVQGVVWDKESVNRVEEVVLGSCAGLDNRDARRRVGDEDIQQAIREVISEIGDEGGCVGGDVDDSLLVSRMDCDGCCVQDGDTSMKERALR